MERGLSMRAGAFTRDLKGQDAQQLRIPIPGLWVPLFPYQHSDVDTEACEGHVLAFFAVLLLCDQVLGLIGRVYPTVSGNKTLS